MSFQNTSVPIAAAPLFPRSTKLEISKSAFRDKFKKIVDGEFDKLYNLKKELDIQILKCKKIVDLLKNENVPNEFFHKFYKSIHDAIGLFYRTKYTLNQNKNIKKDRFIKILIEIYDRNATLHKLIKTFEYRFPDCSSVDDGITGPPDKFIILKTRFEKIKGDIKTLCDGINENDLKLDELDKVNKDILNKLNRCEIIMDEV